MGVLDVRQRITIDRPADVVRRQFADVVHHQETGVHRGVRFEVIDDDGRRCRYRQISRVGPVRLTQEFELPHTEAGPLVNTIIAGQFEGGSITFSVEARDESSSTVEAHVHARSTGVDAMLLPITRRVVRRSLARALVEDKADLERGTYSV